MTAGTKANDLNPILSTKQEKANEWAYGAGHVRPNKAADPGLVYDLSTEDYLNYLCALGYKIKQIKQFSNDTSFVCSKSFKITDLNYPSISIPNLESDVALKIKRRLKNVGSPGTYVVQVNAPLGVSVSVEPTSLKFTGIDEEKSFRVVLKSNVPNGFHPEYVFGKLEWSDGNNHRVRSPIVVKLGKWSFGLSWIKSWSDKFRLCLAHSFGKFFSCSQCIVNYVLRFNDNEFLFAFAFCLCHKNKVMESWIKRNFQNTL